MCLLFTDIMFYYLIEMNWINDGSVCEQVTLHLNWILVLLLDYKIECIKVVRRGLKFADILIVPHADALKFHSYHNAKPSNLNHEN
jgi:hypothetical protein